MPMCSEFGSAHCRDCGHFCGCQERRAVQRRHCLGKMQQNQMCSVWQGNPPYHHNHSMSVTSPWHYHGHHHDCDHAIIIILITTMTTIITITLTITITSTPSFNVVNIAMQTGTLTKGKLEVTQYKIFNNAMDDKTFLYMAGSAENGSEHLIGKALTQFAKVKSWHYQCHHQLSLKWLYTKFTCCVNRPSLGKN